MRLGSERLPKIIVVRIMGRKWACIRERGGKWQLCLAYDLKISEMEPDKGDMITKKML